jgi:hypothetical protein
VFSGIPSLRRLPRDKTNFSDFPLACLTFFTQFEASLLWAFRKNLFSSSWTFRPSRQKNLCKSWQDCSEMAGNVAVECFVSRRKDSTLVKSENYEQSELEYNWFASWCFNDEGLFSDGIVFCSALPNSSTKFFRHVQCCDLWKGRSFICIRTGKEKGILSKTWGQLKKNHNISQIIVRFLKRHMCEE